MKRSDTPGKLYGYLNTDSISHIRDVETLRFNIFELHNVPSSIIEKMYSDFSDSRSAYWLTVDDDSIREFRKWIL